METMNRKKEIKRVGRSSDKLNSLSAGMLGLAFRIIVLAFMCLLLFRTTIQAYRFGRELFAEQGAEEPPGREIRITVTQGMSIRSTAELLRRKGIIKNAWAFRAQAAFFGRKVKPGTYFLNTSRSVKELLEQLDAGPESGGSS